jgi:sugar phosphate isomerase/epimerase
MLPAILERVSYHAVYDHSILDALTFAKANDFTGVQIAVESPHLAFDRLSGAEIRDIAVFREQNDLRISIHAHDTTPSLFETNRYLKKGIFSYFQALFAFAGQIGANIVTIHPGQITTFRTADKNVSLIPDKDMKCLRQTWQNNVLELIRLAENRVMICIENDGLDLFILESFHRFVENNQISLCWDIARSYRSDLSPDPVQQEFVHCCIEQVRQVHLHDRDDSGRSHLVIGEGNIDFRAELERLPVDRILDFCIEVRPRELAQKSLDNLRDLFS